MQGPTATPIRLRSAPRTHIASTVASTMPAKAPRQPACAAPMTPASLSASSTGAQSALRMPKAIPGRRVTAAAARGGYTTVCAMPNTNPPLDSRAAIESARHRATVATAAQLLGVAWRLLDMTVEYVKQREQFGVPIGSFQALQHRAADMFAEVELCKSCMILAAIQADADDPEERAAEISTAKFQLTQGGWFVQSNAIQLPGGIGITDEQDEGLFFKRLRVLQGLFGDADHHSDRFQGLDGFDAEARQL